MEGRKARFWSSYVRRQQPAHPDPLREEHDAMLQAVIREGINFGVIDLPERALTATWRGDTVVCPLDSRGRALQAIVDTEWKLPYPLNGYVVDRESRRRAARLQLEPSVIRDAADTHILSASWQVPFWWALLFDEEERHGSSRASAVFRAPISEALVRARQARELITSAFGVGEFLGELEFVIGWLEQFDLDSMVELDFGALTGLGVRPDSRLSSVDIARQALEYLESDEYDDALAAYHEYMSVWEEAARLESFN